MKRKFLEELGLEKEAIDKIMAENGADIESARQNEAGKFETERATLQGQITDLQGQVTQRDTDLTDLKGKLTAAQEDAGKLTEAQNALTGLQTKYNDERQQWEQKTAQQAYEFMVREQANGLSFTSTAAKRDFIREAIDKKLVVEGDKILGFDDFVGKYKESDPGAFVPDKGPETVPPEDKPDIVLPPAGGTAPGDGKGFQFHFNGVRPFPKE